MWTTRPRKVVSHDDSSQERGCSVTIESNGSRGPDFTNAITREAFHQVLEEWDDPMAIAREWLDIGSGNPMSAVHHLARQLRKDFRREYLRGLQCRADHDFLVWQCFRLGLKAIDWRQVADRLLSRAMREQYERSGSPQESEDEDDKGEDTDTEAAAS
jgi:hypothetical protein